MELNGFKGNDLEIRKVKDNVTVEQLKEATSKNGMDEIVVENEKGKFALFADELSVKGKFGLPSVGENISFGEFHGKVILSDNESPMGREMKSDSSAQLRQLCEKNPADLAAEAKVVADKAKAQLDTKIAFFEKKSDTNTNTRSIYGPQVSKEDAKSWLDNNPFLAQSPKLIKLADFKTIDGKVDADELSRISSEGGAVVLNGPNSFYLPGDNKPAPQANPGAQAKPMTEQEKYYQRKNAEAKAANVGLAVEAGAVVAGSLFDAITKSIR